MDCLDEQIHLLENVILKQARPREAFQAPGTVPGIGKTLALTIALESGDMARFAGSPKPTGLTGQVGAGK